MSRGRLTSAVSIECVTSDRRLGDIIDLRGSHAQRTSSRLLQSVDKQCTVRISGLNRFGPCPLVTLADDDAVEFLLLPLVSVLRRHGRRSQKYVFRHSPYSYIPHLNLSLAVILLSFVLAVGFLMIILSCALWSNWLPLLVGGSTFPLPSPYLRIPLLLPANNSCIRTALTFVLAPLPNALFSHCGADDFSTDYGEGSSPVDLGRFITAFIVVTGFSLPLVLAHSEIIKSGASIMSLIGGGYVRSYSVASALPCLLTTSAFTSRAALYMGLLWPTQPLSDKKILNTNSSSAVPSQEPACINQWSDIITALHLLRFSLQNRAVLRLGRGHLLLVREPITYIASIPSDLVVEIN